MPPAARLILQASLHPNTHFLLSWLFCRTTIITKVENQQKSLNEKASGSEASQSPAGLAKVTEGDALRVQLRFGQHDKMSINPILSETTLEFMLGQDEIFVRAKIQREFEYFDELNIIHNERSEF